MTNVRPKRNATPDMFCWHIDECALYLAYVLYFLGFNVTSVRTHPRLRGATDAAHLRHAYSTRRVIVTRDRGFRSHCQRHNHCGVVILENNEGIKNILRCANQLWSRLPKRRSIAETERWAGRSLPKLESIIAKLDGCKSKKKSNISAGCSASSNGRAKKAKKKKAAACSASSNGRATKAKKPKPMTRSKRRRMNQQKRRAKANKAKKQQAKCTKKSNCKASTLRINISIDATNVENKTVLNQIRKIVSPFGTVSQE